MRIAIVPDPNKIGASEYWSIDNGPPIKVGVWTKSGFKPLIYFCVTRRKWYVVSLNRTGKHWREFLSAFNFCHKLNVRHMEKELNGSYDT